MSVRYGPTGDTAVVGGQGGGRPLSVDYVPPEDPGDGGRAAPHERACPRTVPRGHPGRAHERIVIGVSGSAQENVTATPIADLTNPQYVAVLEWEPQP